MKIQIMRVDLAVVIVSYNVRELLRKCLFSLNSESLPANSVIVVVDNASSDGSAEMVRSEFPNCKFVDMGHNAGFGRATNMGCRTVEAEHYLILNPDTEITNDIILKMLEHVARHPEAAVVGCRMISPAGDIQRSIYSLPDVFSAISGIYRFKSFFPKRYLGNVMRWFSWVPTVGQYLHSCDGFESWRKVQSVPGSCFLVNGPLFHEMGGFDENIFLYSEDTDLFYRIGALCGKEIHLLPQTGVVHHVGQSFKIGFTGMSPFKHWSTLYYFRKNHGLMDYSLINLALFIFAAIKFVFAVLSVTADPVNRKKHMEDCLSVLKLCVYGLDSFNPFPGISQ